MRINKFDFVKDLIVPVLIALVVVIANDYFLKNQKKRETKMVHEEAILLRQYEILNRILLFCVKYSHGHEIFKIKDTILNEYQNELQSQKRKLDANTKKLDSLSYVLSNKKLTDAEIKIISLEIKDLSSVEKRVKSKLEIDPNELTEKEFDSLYYVYSDIPYFLTDKDENRTFNDDLKYFKNNIGLIDHRIGLLVLTYILDTQEDFDYGGSLMTTDEAKKSLWSDSKKYKEWQKNLGILYSVTYEYIYQEKFDGEIPRQKHFKIQDYLDKIQNDLIDSTFIGS